MSRRIVLLGAPLSSNLHWSESDLLTDDELEQFISRKPNATGKYVQWRQLRLPAEQLRASFLQPTEDRDYIQSASSGDPAFFRMADVASALLPEGLGSGQSSSFLANVDSSEDVLSEFYDHSFSLHAGTTSSQPSAVSEDGFGAQAVTEPGERPESIAPPLVGHLSDLEDIPSAKYLTSIIPQTVTVNLIVGVMSLPAPRTVTTGRRWGKEKLTELVEILVGDETRAGFGVTLWLSDRSEGCEMRKRIRHLRLRDIVLFRNVALSTFRDKVYGQSLRRGGTKVDLLYGRNDNNEDGPRGVYSARDVDSNMQTAKVDPQLMKVRQVRDWMEHFLGDTSYRREAHPSSLFGGQAAREDVRKRLLPPDTP